MNAATVAHRWANKDFGKNGTLTASPSCHAEGRNYFSYSAVFGQWLDLEKNVVAIFDGSTSVTSSKYKLSKSEFPKDVHVFPLDFGSNSYYGWSNCNLISSYYKFTDEDFKESHRMQMLDHYVERIYNQFAAINGGKSKGLENVSFEAWGYVEELCSLYKDTTIGKWIKHSTKHEWKNKNKGEDKRKRAMVRLISKGERNVETITDAMFGEGTFKTYWDYCARYRKAADKKAKMLALCERLGIADPYCNNYWGDKWKTRLSADEVRNLTAKERNDIHFAGIMNKAWTDGESERKEKYNKRNRNAYKWIVGFEPTCDKWDGGVNGYVTKARNMFNGDEYDVERGLFSTPYWAEFSVRFNYDEFRNSEDKQAWIEKFYEQCELVANNIYALNTLREFNAHEEQRGRYSWEKAFVLTDDIIDKFNGCAESLAIVEDYIARQDKYFEDELARERAERIARERAEAERKAEEEYRAKVKKEQIAECVSNGAEGCRDLWRKHLTDKYEAESYFEQVAFRDEGDFYYGGNILLRLNLNKDKVETSKGIRIPVEVCKKMWKIVSKWHENPKCFKPMQIDTKGSGTYTISSYENDILTAGCHDIAWTEMERMYNEIIAAV